jgi:hypothetical protein
MQYSESSIWTAKSGCIIINVSGGLAPRGWSNLTSTAPGEQLLLLPKIAACQTAPQYVQAKYANFNCEAPYHLGEIYRSKNTGKLMYSTMYGHYPGQRVHQASVYSFPLNSTEDSTEVDVGIFERGLIHLLEIWNKRSKCEMHMYMHPPREYWERHLHPLVMKHWGHTDMMTVHLSADMPTPVPG